MKRILCGLAAVLAASPLLAQPAPDPGTSVYAKVVRSVVWIQSQRGRSLMTGTGTVIDHDHRLVLTNYHVVGEENAATVLFPAYRDGHPVAERGFYMQRQRELGVGAKVVDRDRQHDLAVIQLDAIPASAPALKLAEKSVNPGQAVHSIGNPGGSGALWVYTPGKVRQVYQKQWKAELDGRVAEFSGEVVETDSATNPGDSGGPLVDDAGRLVAVTQGGAIKANLLSTFIDISEVKKFLNGSSKIREKGWNGGVQERTTALPLRDGGRFFSAAALTAAQESANKVFAKTGLDLMVETYAHVPDSKAEAVKTMNAKEREKFFRDWAHARIKAEGAVGAMLLICREPSHLQVVVSDNPRIKSGEAKKLSEAVIAKFREKKFDEGLHDYIEMASGILTGK